MAECVSAAQWTLPAARRWLRGAAAAQALRGLAQRVTEHNDARARGLLLVCLTSDAQGGTTSSPRPRGAWRCLTSVRPAEMVIGAEAASAAVRVFAAALHDTDGAWLETSAGVAARLAEALTDSPPRGYDSLVAALFRLNVLLPVSTRADAPRGAGAG